MKSGQNAHATQGKFIKGSDYDMSHRTPALNHTALVLEPTICSWYKKAIEDYGIIEHDPNCQAALKSEPKLGNPRKALQSRK